MFPICSFFDITTGKPLASASNATPRNEQVERSRAAVALVEAKEDAEALRVRGPYRKRAIV